MDLEEFREQEKEKNRDALVRLIVAVGAPGGAYWAFGFEPAVLVSLGVIIYLLGLVVWNQKVG